jgi:ankyrin repeat protein
METCVWDLILEHTDATFPWAQFNDAVEAGFPITTATRAGSGALCKAAGRSMSAVTKRLLDLGCDPFDTDDYSQSPMHLAAHVNAVDACKVLPVQCLTARTFLQNTPLHTAVCAGAVQVVQWMLEQPCAPVDARNRRGLTPREEAERMEYRLIERADMLAAFAAHGRWSPLRAAWIGAAVGTKNTYR